MTFNERLVFGRSHPQAEGTSGRPARTLNSILLGVFLGAAACGRSTPLNVGPSLADAGPPAADASLCVDIDPSSYDTSCRTDSDCVLINGGRICAGYDCLCGNATINVSGRARYETVFNAIPLGAGPRCSCPALNTPHCIQGACILCPNLGTPGPMPAGCPDAG